jgi:acyl carrier protein
MFLIEQEFGIEFGDEEFARFETVGQLREAIERKIAA